MHALWAVLLTAMLSVPAIAKETTAPEPDGVETLQVYNEQDEKLGEASALLVNQEGRVAALIVKISDVSAPDEPDEDAVVPINRVKDATGDQKIVIKATMDELKAMPKLRDLKGDSFDTRRNGI